MPAGAAAGLSFDYFTNYSFLEHGLLDTFIDDKPAFICDVGGEKATAYITFDSSTDHTLSIRYNQGYTFSEDMDIAISNVRLLDEASAAKIRDAEPKVETSLSGATAEIELLDGDVKPIVFFDGDYEDEAYIAPGNQRLKLLIRIGEDINPNQVVVNETLLSKLPYNEEGFIYEFTPYEYYSGSETVEVVNDPKNYDSLCSLAFYETEAEADELVDMYNNYETENGNQPSNSWHYADESERSTEKSDTADDCCYSVIVMDENQEPVEGVMLQLCDESTCQMLVTDEHGGISVGDRTKEYDVHILKVPEGYQKGSMQYHIYANASSLVIVLESN